MLERTVRYCSILWLAMYLQSGAYKALTLDWPVDATLLSAALATLGTLLLLLLNGGRFPKQIYVLPLFWAAMLLSSFLLTDHTTYAVDKQWRFYFVTLPSVLITPILIRTTDHLRIFFLCTAALMTLVVIHFLGQPAGLAVGRELLAVDPIVLGMGLSSAAIIGIIYGLRSHKRLATLGWLAFGVAMLVGSLFTGTRQIIVGYAVVVAVLTFYSTKKSKGAILYVLAGIAVVVGAVVAFWEYIPEHTANRLMTIVQLETLLANARSNLLEIAWARFIDNPIGQGIGAFAEYSITVGGFLQAYPHNLYLEVLVEGGIVPGSTLMLIVAVGLLKAFRIAATTSASDTEQLLVLCLLIMAFVGSNVSGDINSHKMLYALLAVVYTCRWSEATSERSPVPRQLSHSPTL